uniref:Uncharacterized protein n=1 Tax=Gorilla gorilla gorilla TaxID=9595 RepID=A0A2I2Z724_GORGO
MGSSGKPLFLLCSPGNCCKTPTCSAPRRGPLLMRTLVQLQPGGERAQEPGSGPAGSSLAPSEPVSAGPRHLGRGQRPGEAGPCPPFCPGPRVLDRRPFWGARELRGQIRAGRPLTPGP